MFGIADVIDEMLPGAELGNLLAGVDESEADNFELVSLLRAWWRQASHAQAKAYALMEKIAGAVESKLGAGSEEFAPAEISTALTFTRRGGDGHLYLAYQLTLRFPRVLDALREGRIDLAKAKAIVYGLEGVEDSDIARQVADRVLVNASERTTGQIATSLRRLVIQVDPDAAKVRYQKGTKERRVELGANPDGTANLFGLSLPAEEANLAMATIDSLARQAKSADDRRTIDQVRADVLLDLLQGKTISGSSRPGTVDLVVDLATLASMSDEPGEIPGWGPVIADVARQVAADQSDCQWLFTATRPESGEVVANGTTRRRPTAALKRWVRARNRNCVFPGCRRPALDSDLDHRKPWSEGGKTRADNLGPLCRYHHRARHEGGWKIERTRDGIFLWTSPLGHTYTVQPQGP